MESVQQIKIEDLEDHPDNPRLVWREDVVDGIAAQLGEAGCFDPAHALLVRPIGGRYQIVRGHHRKQAAIKAEIDTVPCWVREMTDDEAYMQLALGNVQGELSPLELGRHALRAVEPEEGGRGLVGGISEYARQLGRTRQYIVQLRQAAEVWDKTRKLTFEFIDKAQHLSAIHALPQQLWPMLAEWIITPRDPDKSESTPSVNQVQEIAKQVKKYGVPERWAFFLPLLDIVSGYLREKKPTPEDVAELVTTAEGIAQLIESHAERLDFERFSFTVDGFKEWLRKGVGTYSWDLRELRAYRKKVIEQAQAATKPTSADAKIGHWYNLGKHRLYCGDTSKEAFWSQLPNVPFAFADPPYNADNESWDLDFIWEHDWLIEKADIVAVTPGISAIRDFYRGQTSMPYVWSMSCWLDNGMTRGAVGFGNWIYIGLFTKLESIHQNAQDFIRVSVKSSEKGESEHKGRKPSEMIKQLLELFTKPGEPVIDPFLGSGTTLLVAEEQNRVCYGGEINPDYCNEIINRWQEKTGMQAEEIDDPNGL